MNIENYVLCNYLRPLIKSYTRKDIVKLCLETLVIIS